MKNKRNKYLLGYMLCVATFFTQAVNANENRDRLTIYQAMQRVLDRYPTLKISELQVAQAAGQKDQVESSLGWVLNSSSGITHDLTFLGTPSDKLDVTGSIGRKLTSGARLSLNGGYSYEDSSLSFNPALPNPAHTTKLDLIYRLPLLQGNDNPFYAEGLITAKAGEDLAKANQLLTRMTLAEKVKNIFYALVLTEARLNNAKQAVKRAKELKVFINKNVRLGLSAKKDQLQVQAQLHSTLAELSTVQLQKKQQQTSLNRLMLEDWDKSVKAVLIKNKKYKNDPLQDLIKTTVQNHPSVKISQAKLNIANSQINTSRDSKKDSLDFVVSVGSRTSDGESERATVSEQDWGGSVKLEYQHLFDDRGISAKYKKALLEKTIAEQNILSTNDDIRYTVSGLTAEIKAAKLAVKSASKKLKSESKKLKEAEYLFRNGRANTAELIQFQNEYSFAQLSYQNQRVGLNNRIIALEIFSGQFWDELNMKSTNKGVGQ